MKCPNCGELLGFASTVCLSCNTNIRSGQPVSESDPKRPVEEHDKNPATDDAEQTWITLVSYPDIGEARALVGWLESNGIKTNLPDKPMRSTLRSAKPDALIRVQVTPEDHAAAQRYLAVLQQGPPDFNEYDQPNGERTAPHGQQPLSWLMRWFAFAMPLLACASPIVFSIARSGYKANGRERQARELSYWFVAGVIFWGAAFIVLLTRSG